MKTTVLISFVVALVTCVAKEMVHLPNLGAQERAPVVECKPVVEV